MGFAAGMRSSEPCHTMGVTASHGLQVIDQLLIALWPERREHGAVREPQSQRQLVHGQAGAAAARRVYSIT